MRTLGRIFALVALAGLAMTGAAGAQAAEWRFNNNYAPTRPESQHIRDFAANVGKASDDSLKINVIEGGGMNLKDADALRWMLTGTPEISFIWPPFIGRDAPDLATLYVYGSVSTAEEHLKALPIIKDVLKTGFEARGIPVVGFMGLPVIDATLFCREPVRSLDELKTKKVRVGTRDQVDTFSSLGVAAQIVPQNELYSALQTGVVDCALYAARFAKSVSLQEVARHATYSGFPFPPAPYAIVVNKEKYEALTDEQRAAIASAAETLEANSTDFSKDAEAEAAARADLTASGVTWYDDFSAADKEAIRAAALATWQKITGEAGPEANAIREKIVQSLK